MNKWIAAISTLLMTVLLSACGPIYQTTYSYQPPVASSGKMCATQCFQTKNMCQQSCQFQDQTCRAEEHKNAFYRFQAYSHQQESQGKKVKRSINDFDNSYSVCHHSCNCTNDFNLCYKSCGGTVRQNRVCTAFCK